MKKSLLLAMFFGMWGLAWGQKKEIFKNLQKDTLLKDSLKDRQIRTYVVEYDFSTGLFPNRKQIKPRVDVPIIFKIKNINRLAYKIDIACRDSIIGHTDLIGLETLIKKNEAEKLKTDLKKAETPAVVQANILPVNKYDFRKPDKDFTTLIDSINKFEVSLLKKLETKLAEIQSASETKADPANIEKPDSTQKKDTIHIEKANPANIKEPDNTHIEIEIPIILEQKIPYHFTFQVNLTELYLEIVQKYKVLISLGNDYLQVRTIINNPLLNVKDTLYKKVLVEVYHKFNDNKNSLDDFNLLINRFQNLYKAIKSNPEIIEITNYGGSLKLFSMVESLNVEVTAMKDQIGIIKFDTLKKGIEQIYSLFILSKDQTPLFEYVSSPIQPFRDVAIFDVKIDKIDKIDKDTSPFYNERIFSHKEFTKNGLRFDFNVGIAGSFFSKDNFYKIKTDASNVNRIILADNSGFSPSFVGFLTASRRSATQLTWGMSTGLGISADDGTVTLGNFFIGPSFVAGRHERINLTAGISFKNLPRLNGAYKANDIVPNGYTIDNVATKSYQTGLFIALTYNLTKGIKDNMKQIRSFL